MKKSKFILTFFALLMMFNSNFNRVDAMEIESKQGNSNIITESLYLSPSKNKLKFKELEPTIIDSDNENEIIVGNDDLVLVKNTLQYPYSTSAYVDIENGYARGSANFITDNILITAAHNVYDRENNRYYKNISVIPAVSPNEEPFGKISVIDCFIISDYKSFDKSISSKNDLALLVIDEPIGAKTGTLGLYNKSSNYLNKSATITGYPSYKFETKQMYTNSQKILSDSDEFLKYEIDTLRGSSGSAIYDSNLKVIGVHVAGNPSKNKNIAIKLNDKNLSFIYSIINKNSLNGWKLLNNNWYYYINSNKIISDWFFDSSENKKYYLNETGIMEKGWFLDKDNYWYFFNRTSGFMERGWLYDEDKWYFLDRETGIMEKGWFLDEDNKWYFLDRETGAMKTGWLADNDKWFFLTETGAMKTGWHLYDGYYYFLQKSNGEMVTGKQIIDGKTYNFSDSGKLIS